MAVTTTPSKDRPLYKRMTVIGGAILSVVSYLETQDLIPPGTGEHLSVLVEHAGVLLMGLGVYRHIPST